MFKKLFLSLLILFSFSFKAKAKTCIDFTQGGLIPLILILEQEIRDALLKINIKINISYESIVETLSDEIWKSTVSINDALDENADLSQEEIEAGTLSIIDAINFLVDLEQVIKDRNLSKSGNIPRCTPGGPFEITESGYYALEGNTNCCLAIKASDVTLDLNDFTLFCTDDDVIKTSSLLKNIEIKNGKIKSDRTQNGIFVDNGCQLVSIENVTIFECDKGILFSGELNNEIENCVVKDCFIESSTTGVRLSFANKCLLQNCTVANCLVHGFYQSSSYYNVYEGCTALNISSLGGFLGWGFLSSNGKFNLFSQCKAFNMGSYGIQLLEEEQSKVVSCIFNRMGFVGIALTLATVRCIFESNELLNSDGYGILVSPGINAQNNLFIKNIAYKNAIANYEPAADIGNVYIYQGLNNRFPFLLDNLDVRDP